MAESLRRFLAISAIAMLVASCGSSTTDEEQAAPRSSTAAAPPTISARELANGPTDPPPQLPQLIGLTESEARRWAADSGFETVVLAMKVRPWLEQLEFVSS